MYSGGDEIDTTPGHVSPEVRRRACGRL